MRRYAFKLTLLYKLKKKTCKIRSLHLSDKIPLIFFVILFSILFPEKLYNYLRYRNIIFLCLIGHQKLWHQMSLCLKTSRSLRWKVHLVDLPIHSNWKDPKFPPSNYWKFLKILKNAYNFFIIRLNNILGWRATFANIKVKDQSHSKIILTSFVSLLLRVSELQTLQFLAM